MTVLICGGRAYANRGAVRRVLEQYDPKTTRIVHGAATGADALADQEARALGFDVKPYPADWRRGPVAGHERNARMLVDSCADVVIAFPGGDGTAHMIRISRAIGVPVVVFDYGLRDDGSVGLVAMVA